MLPVPTVDSLFLLLIPSVAIALYGFLSVLQQLAKRGKKDVRNIPVNLFILQIGEQVLLGVAVMAALAGFVFWFVARYPYGPHIAFAGFAVFCAAGIHFLRLRRYLNEKYAWGLAIIDLDSGVVTAGGNVLELPVGRVIDTLGKVMGNSIVKVLESRTKGVGSPHLLDRPRIVDSLTDDTHAEP